MGLEQVLAYWNRVDLGVMAMKMYSTLPRSPELQPYNKMQFSSFIPKRPPLFGGSLQGRYLVYSKPY